MRCRSTSPFLQGSKYFFTNDNGTWELHSVDLHLYFEPSKLAGAEELSFLRVSVKGFCPCRRFHRGSSEALLVRTILWESLSHIITEPEAPWRASWLWLSWCSSRRSNKDFVTWKDPLVSGCTSESTRDCVVLATESVLLKRPRSNSNSSLTVATVLELTVALDPRNCFHWKCFGGVSGTTSATTLDDLCSLLSWLLACSLPLSPFSAAFMCFTGFTWICIR